MLVSHSGNLSLYNNAVSTAHVSVMRVRSIGDESEGMKEFACRDYLVS